MNKNSKIFLVIILFILIGGLIFLFSSYTNENMINTTKINNSNNSNESVNNTENSNLNTNTSSQLTKNNISSNVKNNNYIIKHNPSKNTNKKILISKKEAYSLAKKELKPFNNDYYISYQSAKFWKQTGIEYWSFTVYEKSSGEQVSFIYVDAVTKYVWGSG